MHWPDTKELKQFYSSRLGGLAQYYVEEALLPWREKLNGHNVLGLGYAIPYLGSFLGNRNHVIAVMPEHEGAIHWPCGAPCLSTVAQELELPLADASIDMVILVHALEYSEQPAFLLQEIWRVLSASGQLVVIVPNRGGLWAHAETSVFGSGQPYSVNQLKRLFEANMFAPRASKTILFTPPVNSFLSRPHRLLEICGKRMLGAFGGLLIGSAQKQVYATTKQLSTSYQKKSILVPAIGTASVQTRAQIKE
jgi:SAM-dependent methyltransferase